MALKDTLFADLKTAMKEKDAVRKNTIQMVRAGVLQVEKDSKATLDDEGVLDVIIKELKKRRDALPDYHKSGRQELIQELEQEIEVLLSYLPQQLNDDELEQIVVDIIKEIGAASMKDMGKVMAAITPKIKGRADNKKVSNLIKQQLQA